MSVVQKAQVLAGVMMATMAKDVESLRIKRMRPAPLSSLILEPTKLYPKPVQAAAKPQAQADHHPYGIGLGLPPSSLQPSQLPPVVVHSLRRVKRVIEREQRVKSYKDHGTGRASVVTISKLDRVTAIPGSKFEPSSHGRGKSESVGYSASHVQLPRIGGKETSAPTQKKLFSTSLSNSSLPSRPVIQPNVYGLPQRQSQISNLSSSKKHTSAKSLTAQMYDLDRSLGPSRVRKARKDAAIEGRALPLKIAAKKKEKKVVVERRNQIRLDALVEQIERAAVPSLHQRSTTMMAVKDPKPSLDSHEDLSKSRNNNMHFEMGRGTLYGNSHSNSGSTQNS